MHFRGGVYGDLPHLLDHIVVSGRILLDHLVALELNAVENRSAVQF